MHIFRNDEITVDGVEELSPEKILISPGPACLTERHNAADIERFAGRVPILGVCLGHQAIGQHFGGNVVRGPEPVHGKPVTVKHDGKSLFVGIEGEFQAGRYHSLVVERKSLPDSLEISAESPDGLIMGCAIGNCLSRAYNSTGIDPYRAWQGNAGNFLRLL
jgi:anthranilate synthase/aminodeoxychorismate synthase-like glutamine amidotransferase